MMRVVVDVHGPNAARWREALQQALPDATIVAPGAPEADYAAVWRPSPDLFTRTRVRAAVFNLGAGVDALLALPTLPATLPVFRLVDAGMAEQMAEYAVAAVLRVFRDLDVYAAAQAARQWTPRERRDKRSFGIGVLGLGALGRNVLEALRPFGFPLHGYARRNVAIDGVTTYAAPHLREFLGGCAVCICLAPSTPQTRGLFDRERLAWLPAGAHLVNLARGDLVVEADLLAALDAGRLGGATLDVFATEPLPASHAFWHHPKVVVTPHVSAVTLLPESAAQVADGIRALEAGREPPGRVDRARGY